MSFPDITAEINDMFAEYQDDDISGIMQDLYNEDSSINLAYTSQKDTERGRISSLSEVFLEWYLFDSNDKKDIPTFLKNEDLTDIFTENQFMDLMCGDAYLDELLVAYVALKLPFTLSLKKLNYLNSRAQYNTMIHANDTIGAQIKQLIQIKKEQQTEQQTERRKQYYLSHQEEILQKHHEYYLEHRDEIQERNRQWIANHLEQWLAYQKQWRIDNAEHLKKYHKQYRENNPEIISMRKKKCYNANKEHYQQQHKEYYEINKPRVTIVQQAYNAKQKRKSKSAQKICAAYVFLTTLKKTNLTKYLELYTYQQRPLTGMVKTCPALQSMDINLCPLCNPDCGNNICECCNQKVLSLPNALAELQDIASELTKQEQTRVKKNKQKKEYYANNRAEIAKKRKIDRETNPEKYKRRKQVYQIVHKYEIAERRKKHREEHPEETRAQARQSYHNNLDKRRAYDKERRQDPKRKAYMQAYHKKRAKEKSEDIQKQKKAWYEANKERLTEQAQQKHQEMKQKQESAKKICAAYVFLLNLRRHQKPKFLELYTAQANPLIGMLKICPALQNMDINMCPFCNAECGQSIENCCNQKALSVPNATAEIMAIANNLRQQQH